MFISKLAGIIGLLLISTGILLKDRKTQDFFYVTGGACLLLYSASIRDMIFIILQIVFIAAAVYDLIKVFSEEKILRRKRKSTKHDMRA